MEDCNIGKKRERDDYSVSSESKRSRVDSPSVTSELDPVNSVIDSSESDTVDSITVTSESYRVDSNSDTSDSDRVVSEIPEMNSPETIKITEDILNILDDPDSDPEIQDLDSVIKSFEVEILNPDPVTDSVDLDYLLGASDDELGLPPAISPSNEQPEKKISNLDTNPPGAVENFAFVDELPSYDSFGIGEDNGDFVTLGGLFDYSEAAEYSWRPESLSAL